MALTLISTPRRDDTPISGISDVAAGLSQLPYKFSRQDLIITGSEDLDGFQYIYTAGDVTAELEAGHLIFLNSSIITSQTAYILTFEYFATPDETHIQISIPWSVGTGAGFINLLTGRPGYLVLIEPVDAITGISYLPYPETYRTKDNGDLFLDILNLLILIEVEGEALNYRLRYSERWGGMTRNTETDLAVFAVPAKKQLLDVGGSNMWDFLLNAAPAGSQMTKFLNPVTWVGWSSNFYQILDANVLTRNGITNPSIFMQARDKNGVFLDPPITIPITPDPLPQIHAESIPESLKTLENAYSIWVTWQGDATPPDLTAGKSYLIKSPCRNPVLLEWLNSNGAREQWLFDTMQTIDNEGQPGLSFETPKDDTLDNINATIKRLSSGNIQYLTLFAEKLTLDQIQALHEIKESPALWLWLNETGQSKVRVIVEGAFNTPINTDAVSHDFNVQIRLPRNFNFYK